MPKLVLTSFFAILTLSACSSGASLVRTDTLGGQVRLQGAYMPAMGQARMLMVEHCAGRYAYLELGQELEFHCQSSENQAPAASEGQVASIAGY